MMLKWLACTPPRKLTCPVKKGLLKLHLLTIDFQGTWYLACHFFLKTNLGIMLPSTIEIRYGIPWIYCGKGNVYYFSNTKIHLQVVSFVTYVRFRGVHWVCLTTPPRVSSAQVPASVFWPAVLSTAGVKMGWGWYHMENNYPNSSLGFIHNKSDRIGFHPTKEAPSSSNGSKGLLPVMEVKV